MSKEMVTQFVARQLTEQSSLLRLLALDENGTPYRQRFIYPVLAKYLEDFLASPANPRWLIIPGLRGVGKSTILAQLYFAFERRFPGGIFYLSVDQVVKKLNATIFDVVDAYEEVVGGKLHRSQEPRLFLLDEVHYDPEWQSALKALYDNTRKVFVVCSGSSALSLQLTTDVARRATLEKMLPLSFREYLLLSRGGREAEEPEAVRDLGKAVADALFGSADAREAHGKLSARSGAVRDFYRDHDALRIHNYLRYHALPSTLAMSDPGRIYRHLGSVIDRIVEKDLPDLRVFDRPVLNKVSSLLFLLAAADVSSLHSLARDLGEMDLGTLRAVFDVLEKTELLFRVRPYGSAGRQVRKPSKYLFPAPCLRAALAQPMAPEILESRLKGKLLEDAVGRYLLAEAGGPGGDGPCYDPGEGGADFVLTRGKSRVVLEVGWGKRDASQVQATLKKIGGDYGILLTDGLLKLDADKRIVTVPLEYFFLL